VVGAVFRTLPIVTLPGCPRPMIRAEQYAEFLEEHTYRRNRHARSYSASVLHHDHADGPEQAWKHILWWLKTPAHD
jgi:hypothetical protein